MDLENYYLDISEVSKLSENDRSTIYDYYKEMLFCQEDQREIVAKSLFNTLLKNKFLISIREEKIDGIINGDNSLDN